MGHHLHQDPYVMSRLDDLLEYYPDATFVVADGFDDAIIGLTEDEERIVYSVAGCLRVLCEDMSYEEAMEYFMYNVIDSKPRKDGPVFVWDNFWCYEE